MSECVEYVTGWADVAMVAVVVLAFVIVPLLVLALMTKKEWKK